jgi:hypothetical protein
VADVPSQLKLTSPQETVRHIHCIWLQFQVGWAQTRVRYNSFQGSLLRIQGTRDINCWSIVFTWFSPSFFCFFILIFTIRLNFKQDVKVNFHSTLKTSKEKYKYRQYSEHIINYRICNYILIFNYFLLYWLYIIYWYNIYWLYLIVVRTQKHFVIRCELCAPENILPNQQQYRPCKTSKAKIYSMCFLPLGVASCCTSIQLVPYDDVNRNKVSIR